MMRDRIKSGNTVTHLIIKNSFLRECTRGGREVTPPFFLIICNFNNNEIYMNNSYMF
jgi:hypothetical protein